MTQLEFWPDYGAGPLWSEDGKAVDLQALGLPDQLVERLTVWNGQYAEERVPLEGSGDAEWLSEGVVLLRRTRKALGSTFQIVVTEPWWDEDPT